MIKALEMTKKELKTLSSKILDYRAKNNLSAGEFAELCNLTMPTIYNIENCKQAPSKMTLRKILHIIQDDCVCGGTFYPNGKEVICNKCGRRYAILTKKDLNVIENGEEDETN